MMPYWELSQAGFLALQMFDFDGYLNDIRPQVLQPASGSGPDTFVEASSVHEDSENARTHHPPSDVRWIR